jgi:hypothetical protein
LRSILITAVIFLCFALISAAEGRSVSRFECGSRFVAVGDSRFEVLSKCGQPSWRDAWEEERLERVYGTPYRDGSPDYELRVPLFNKVHVRIEEWVYNRGQQRFIRVLRFENNRLINIEVGDYGY